MRGKKTFSKLSEENREEPMWTFCIINWTQKEGNIQRRINLSTTELRINANERHNK